MDLSWAGKNLPNISLRCPNKLGNLGANLLGAIMAEILSNLVRSPFELLKNQAQVGHRRSVFQGLSELFRTFQLRQIYRGLSTLMLREIPFSCIQLPFYQAMKAKIIEKRTKGHTSDGNLSAFEAALVGFIAGGSAAFLTNPNDVVKSNVMGEKGSGQEFRLKGVVQSATSLYKEHGIRVFFRGALIRSLHVGFMSISFFFWYESANRFWKKALGSK